MTTFTIPSARTIQTTVIISVSIPLPCELQDTVLLNSLLFICRDYGIQKKRKQHTKERRNLDFVNVRKKREF